MNKRLKCCFNCLNAMKYAIPQKDLSVYQWVINFNAQKRICGANYRQPSYLMYEKRSCKGFEDKQDSMKEGLDDEPQAES